jgi:hypothetical protein
MKMQYMGVYLYLVDFKIYSRLVVEKMVLSEKELELLACLKCGIPAAGVSNWDSSEVVGILGEETVSR